MPQSHLGGAKSEKYLSFLQTLRDLNAPWDGVPNDELEEALKQRQVTTRAKLADLLKDSPDLAERAYGFLGGNLGYDTTASGA